MSMTARQKQGILALIADKNGEYYYNGPLDGKWGPKSQAAAERFLADFTGKAEEAPQKPPDSFWDEIEYFDRGGIPMQMRWAVLQRLPRRTQ